MFKKYLFILVAIPLWHFNSLAQVDELIWVDYTANRYINDRLEFFGDVGYRSFLFDDALTRLNIRPGVEFGPNDRWDFTGGIGFFYEIRPRISDRFEIRPFQGVRYHIDPSDRLKMNLYFRVEERFSFDKLSENDLDFDVRFRLRLSGKYEFLNPKGDNYWFIPYSLEVFVPVDNSLTDILRERERGFLGVGYNANDTWRYTFLLNYEVDGGIFTGNANFDTLIFQFKVRHNIPIGLK